MVSDRFWLDSGGFGWVRVVSCFINNEDIGSCLVNTLNYSFEHGELTSSQKQAVITLIKKRAETRDLSRTGDYSHSSMLTQKFQPKILSHIWLIMIKLFM